jgi:hypothetical protein
MSIKSKVLGGTAALAVMAGGLGVAGAVTAHAATPSCGSRCVALTNPALGGVTDVYKRTAKVGQAVITWGATNYDPAEDFTFAAQGTVHQFYKAGLASSALNLHYSKDLAFEIQYTPYGVDTGLCIGTGSVAGNGTKVTLQPCGNSSKTLWVFDKADASWSGSAPVSPLINGSDQNFATPYVLTDSNGSLVTRTLNKFSNGTIVDSQIWTYAKGVL